MYHENEPESGSDKAARYLSSHTPELFKQAKNKIESRLQQDPNNGKLWFQLGNTCRGLGDLKNAGYAFKQARELEHEPLLSDSLAALCSQSFKKLTYPNNDFTPSPFLRSFDLLSDEELSMAWQMVKDHSDKFKDSRVGEGQVKIRKTTRDSIVLGGKKFKPLRELFKAHITPIIDRAFDAFSIEPPAKQGYTVQMTLHADGQFYRTHTDAGSTYARILSYVYYFHKQPQAFTGGQLQLFDTNTKLNTASTTMTTIKPIHNSLIIFPSNYYHQVCTVNMPNHDRIWGRHTINGWLVDAEKQAEVDAKLKEG